MADAPCFLLLAGPQAAGLYADITTPGGAQGNSGLDLRFPADCVVPPDATRSGRPLLVDLGVRARCVLRGQCVPFQLMARSSIGKTPLGLANSVGLFDRGYTGSVWVAVRNHSDEDVLVKRGDALFQLVGPNLEPACAALVAPDHPCFARDASLRAEGGLGSTGAAGCGPQPPKESRD